MQVKIFIQNINISPKETLFITLALLASKLNTIVSLTLKNFKIVPQSNQIILKSTRIDIYLNFILFYQSYFIIDLCLKADRNAVITLHLPKTFNAQSLLVSIKLLNLFFLYGNKDYTFYFHKLSAHCLTC